jgi:hypothetical protein
VEGRGDPRRAPSAERDRQRDSEPSENDGYATAQATLSRLPDLGAALLEAARAELPPGTPLAQLVIHAATLTRRTA